MNKSKQERIRDNQRRSRARRQEHLADLEKRLSDCHSTCREADLQREAFRDLQQENARLRELLALSGLDSAWIESQVRQRDNQPQDSKSSLRSLKPKIRINDQGDSLGSAQLASKEASASPFLDLGTAGEDDPEHDFISAANVSQFATVLNMQYLQADSCLSDGSSSARGGCCPRASSEEQTQATGPSHTETTSFCCDTFHVSPNGPLLKSSENTILCSVAKEMIDQYNVNSQNMDLIKARLSMGFSRPTFPGQGCRVNNQLLFDVLNEISSNLS